MKKTLISLLVTASIAQVAVANESPNEVEILKQEIKKLTERLDSIESSSKTLKTSKQVAKKRLKAHLVTEFHLKLISENVMKSSIKKVKKSEIATG